MKMTLAERLWGHVDKSGDCWVWTGGTSRNGYGRITDDRRGWGTHRLAWVLTFGPIPPGLHVCHRCDNRPCCNPAHLFLGTASDNMRDAVAKGRQRPTHLHGSANPRAKLAEADVAEIRRLLAAGCSKKSLSRQFPVSRATIQQIAAGKTWRQVLASAELHPPAPIATPRLFGLADGAP